MLRVVMFGFIAAVVIAMPTVACSSFSSQPTPGPDAEPPANDAAADAAVESDACDMALVSTDDKNCGRCGHDCLGGACIDKKCQPVKLGSSSDAPVLDVVVDATRV